MGVFRIAQYLLKGDWISSTLGHVFSYISASLKLEGILPLLCPESHSSIRVHHSVGCIFSFLVWPPIRVSTADVILSCTKWSDELGGVVVGGNEPRTLPWTLRCFVALLLP